MKQEIIIFRSLKDGKLFNVLVNAFLLQELIIGYLKTTKNTIPPMAKYFWYKDRIYITDSMNIVVSEFNLSSINLNNSSLSVVIPKT